jgi:hypothetical protein
MVRRYGAIVPIKAFGRIGTLDVEREPSRAHGGSSLTLLPSAPCTEYVLRFDQDQILRAWSRQPWQGFKPGPVSNP